MTIEQIESLKGLNLATALQVEARDVRRPEIAILMECASKEIKSLVEESKNNTAPDLLAALRECLADLEDITRADGGDDSPAMIQARTIISKAEGRAE